MKKILKVAMILSLLSFFVACDESMVDSGITPKPGIDSDPARQLAYNPVGSQTANSREFKSFEEFKAAVNNGEFLREGNVCYNENIQVRVQAYETVVSEQTYFTIFHSSTAEMVDTEIFNRELYDGVIDYQFDESGEMKYEYSEIIEKLSEILDDAKLNRFENMKGTRFSVLTSKNITYTIDLNLPLIANPVSAYDADTATGYYYKRINCLY